MRFAFVRLALILLALSAAAPLAEAFEDCRLECTAGAEEECGTTGCCSCCPVARFIMTGTPDPEHTLEPSRERVVVTASLLGDAEPRGILHVPKDL